MSLPALAIESLSVEQLLALREETRQFYLRILRTLETKHHQLQISAVLAFSPPDGAAAPPPVIEPPKALSLDQVLRKRPRVEPTLREKVLQTYTQPTVTKEVYIFLRLAAAHFRKIPTLRTLPEPLAQWTRTHLANAVQEQDQLFELRPEHLTSETEGWVRSLSKLPNMQK